MTTGQDHRQETTVSSPQPTLADLLSSGPYRWLYVATLHWNLARWMEMLVLPWLAYELTGSAWQVALIGFFRNAPLLVFGLAGGVVADRRDRKHVLLVAQAINLAVSLLLTLFLALQRLTFWEIVVASILLGSTWVFDWPARRSLLADMVDRRLIVRAFALDGLNQNAMRVVGPLVGGSLVAHVGLPGCYALLSLVYVGAFTTLIPLVPPKRSLAMVSSSLYANLRAGLHAVWIAPAVLGVMAITVTMNMLAFPFQQVLPVFAVRVLGLDADGLGALSAANGVGSLVGAAIMIWFGYQAKWQGWLFLAGSALASVALVLFAGASWFPICLLLLMLNGLGQSAFGSLQSSIVVNGVEPEMRGRAMGVLALAIGSSPIGALLIGALANRYGPAFAIGLCAVVCFVLVIATGIAIPSLRAPIRPLGSREEIGSKSSRSVAARP